MGAFAEVYDWYPVSFEGEPFVALDVGVERTSWTQCKQCVAVAIESSASSSPSSLMLTSERMER